jgi:hypothetical protein
MKFLGNFRICGLVVRGFIKFVGNYETCLEKFSQFSSQLFGAHFKSAEIVFEKPSGNSPWTSTLDTFGKQHQMSVARYHGVDYHLIGNHNLN